jgi:hypothetical protein
MGNRSYKKRIASLEIRIAEHFQKINAELASVNPNVGLIKHWEAEINPLLSVQNAPENGLDKRILYGKRQRCYKIADGFI